MFNKIHLNIITLNSIRIWKRITEITIKIFETQSYMQLFNFFLFWICASWGTVHTHKIHDDQAI